MTIRKAFLIVFVLFVCTTLFPTYAGLSLDTIKSASVNWSSLEAIGFTPSLAHLIALVAPPVEFVSGACNPYSTDRATGAEQEPVPTFPTGVLAQAFQDSFAPRGWQPICVAAPTTVLLVFLGRTAVATATLKGYFTFFFGCR